MKPVQTKSSTPIRIGYCLSLSGVVGGNGRAAHLAHQIWLDNVNARGGLLGRPVELICYDDASDAANVAPLYRRLMDEDKVDLVVGGYGTNTVLPAMPLIIERQRFFIGLMGLGVNNDLAYENYFAMIPTGSDPNAALTAGFFELATQQVPRPWTAALLSADAEFSKNPIRGAKANAAKYGFEVVHEAVYPLNTTDFTPLMDDVAKSQCDLLFICSYLQDSIDLVKAVHAHAFRPKMVGASMIGPQNALVKAALGPLLNGFVNYEYWVPVPSMRFPGVDKMLSIYRARAVGQDVDPLGHYMAPTAYAQMQVLEQAVEATGGLQDAALAAYARANSFDTVMGTVRFGVRGEWTEPRVVQVQFQSIDGNDPMQFLDEAKQVVVSPAAMQSGKLIYPYANAIPENQ
jgi:branched-chain amino acid transport system substrate-binding protein